MRRWYIYAIAILWAIQFSPILADEWLDVALDLQEYISREVTISPADKNHIDMNLTWAQQCMKKQSVCSTEYEKMSIRETLKKLENLWEKYQIAEKKDLVLEYILKKTDTFEKMTQENVPPMGPVVTDILLQIVYQNLLDAYNKEMSEKTERHHNALKYLPAWTVIPTIPKSKTNQAIVIDISDQRLYAFEEGMLIYTNPITSGKNWFGTVRWDFSVMNKQRNRLLRSPFKNERYSLHVDYWIQFYPKYGIHDACNSKSCWREEFGGQDYKTRWSHGCVNSPYEAVKWLYDWALIDTAVRVQK